MQSAANIAYFCSAERPLLPERGYPETAAMLAGGCDGEVA